MGKFWLVVLFCLAALLVVLVGAPLLLPAELDVEAAIRVDAPPARVATWLESPTAWKEWNSFARAADASAFVASGPERGVGAELTWTRGDHPETLRITKVEPGTLVQYEILRAGQPMSGGQFLLTAEGDRTQVVWRHRGVFDTNFFQPVVLFLVRDRVQRSLNEGLAELRTRAESAR
ncbi:MAG: SRPBCC family protein [Planctomycetes bacterium]|nr:SRPBCC family protein [Planctomycetota bacterium]MCC7172770.1 SRPBCC family protein [Planctomycetota bacterium]